MKTNERSLAFAYSMSNFPTLA